MIASSSSDGNGQSDKPNIGFWQSLVDDVRSIFNDSQWEQQKRVFDEALAEYPSRVVQRAELFDISRTTCSNVRGSLDQALTQADSTGDGYLRLLRQLESALIDMRKEGEAVLSPEFIKKSSAKSGILEDFERWRRGELMATATAQIGVSINEINTLVRRAASPTLACVEALAAAEEAQDAILESSATTKALRETILDARYANWSSRRLAELESVRRRLDVEVTPRIRGRCAS
jgi:hypothetical protein